ncbi:MAG: hypothetical protein D6732_25000, partial [Methanobacteriota archaeon]
VSQRGDAVAQFFNITNLEHIENASELISQGEIIIAGFNGVFGIFGDADCPEAIAKILEAKNRPVDKNLILVSPPEFLYEHLNLSATVFQYHPLEKIKQLYQEIHALGMILPAAVPGAPYHLVREGTILNIWTEYPPHQPIRKLVLALRNRGKRALVGTSANKSGQPTFTCATQVVEAFNDDVAAVLSDSFEHLPAVRRKSTTIVDFTGEYPRLYREGSVPESELREHIERLGFRKLIVDENVIKV